MHRVIRKIVRFIRAEDGPTSVEYAVMLALVVVVCIASISALGSNTNSTFSFVSTKLKAAGS